MSKGLMPLPEAARAVAQAMPTSKRGLFTAVLQECVKRARAQGKDRAECFRYASLVCDNERKLGEQLSLLPRAAGGPGRGKKVSQNETAFFRELEQAGIDRNRAYRAQQLAAISAADYHAWIDGLRDQLNGPDLVLPTLSGLASLANGNGTPSVSQNTGAFGWYTPAEYVDAARAVMGGIDLDPASSARANETIRAKRFYSADGCALPWQGRVWCNPPFNLLAAFAPKLAAELQGRAISQAILLTPNYSDSTWWQICHRASEAICHTDHRIRFVNSVTGRPHESPTGGHTFFYFGKRIVRFAERFAKFGAISRPER